MIFMNRKAAVVTLKDGRTGMLQGITKVMELFGYQIKFENGERHCADKSEILYIKKIN
jgi:hypothetical protein